MVWFWFMSILTVALLLPASVAAHGDLHEQIAAITRRIDEAPSRAEVVRPPRPVHRVHGEWEAALADYDRAARLDPDLIVIDFVRAVALLDAGAAGRHACCPRPIPRAAV